MSARDAHHAVQRLTRVGRAGLAAVLITGTVGAAFLAAAPAATAEVSKGFEGAFTGVANAHATRIQLNVPSAPVSPEVLDVGGPSALAELDSIGSSRAYAAYPFPGEVTANYPGLVRGLSGAPVPPDYPLFITSRYPATPSAQGGGGPVALSATSEEDASHGLAVVGSETGDDQVIGLARSESTAQNAAGQVAMVGKTEVSGVRVGPLTIGHYISDASAIVNAQGVLNLATSTLVTGTEIDGTAVTLTSEGFAANGPPTSLKSAMDALAAAGVTVQFIPATKTSDSIGSASLQITRKLDTGETLTITLGQATAALNAPESKAGAGVPTTTQGSDAGAAGTNTGPGGTAGTAPTDAIALIGFPSTSAAVPGLATTAGSPAAAVAGVSETTAIERTADTGLPASLAAVVVPRAASSTWSWVLLLIAAGIASALVLTLSGKRSAT